VDGIGEDACECHEFVGGGEEVLRAALRVEYLDTLVRHNSHIVVLVYLDIVDHIAAHAICLCVIIQ